MSAAARDLTWTGGLARMGQLVLLLHVVLKLGFAALLALLLRERFGDLAPAWPELHSWLFRLDRLGWGFAAVGVALLMALVHRAALALEALGRPGLRSPRALALSVSVPPLQLHAGQATFEDLWARSQPGAGAEPENGAAGHAPTRTPSACRFWQHWVMGGFAAWLGTFALGVMMVPEPVALALLFIGLAMQLWADLWGLRAASELRSRLHALAGATEGPGGSRSG